MELAAVPALKPVPYASRHGWKKNLKSRSNNKKVEIETIVAKIINLFLID